MKIAVVIASVGRPDVLRDTITSLQNQSLSPDQIIASVASMNDIPEGWAPGDSVEVVLSERSLTKQRNRALDRVLPETDLLAFMDDDMELCPTYLSHASEVFSSNLDVVIACNQLLYDGGKSAPISREDAIKLCEATPTLSDQAKPKLADVPYAYGCNMIVRYSAAREVRFDEGLPLYGWLEDADYGVRCVRAVDQGRIVEFSPGRGVHMGATSGRISGIRFGFSQFVNPWYLYRKQVFSITHAVQLGLRCLVGNSLGIITRDHSCDRWGRFRGNMLGALHLMMGRCDPSRILDL